MKRFHVVLILVGGFALGVASAAAEVIRNDRANEKRIVNTGLSKPVAKEPSQMKTRRGERFQKKAALKQYQVGRKSSVTSGKIISRTRSSSSVPLRTFPVVRIGSSTTR